MEDYRERLRTGQVISDAVPLQQRLPEQGANLVDAVANIEENEGGDSPQTPDNESSGKSDFEDDKTAEKDSDMDASPEDRKRKKIEDDKTAEKDSDMDASQKGKKGKTSPINQL
jgi:hypothetical protein